MQNLWLYPDGRNQKLWGWDAVICCVMSLPGDFDAIVISLGRGELGVFSDRWLSAGSSTSQPKTWFFEVFRLWNPLMPPLF